jgi:hypothetical protein
MSSGVTLGLCSGVVLSLFCFERSKWGEVREVVPNEVRGVSKTPLTKFKKFGIKKNQKNLKGGAVWRVLREKPKKTQGGVV